MTSGEDLSAERLRKRDLWVSRGHPAYPHHFPDRVPSAQIREVLKDVPPGGSREDLRRRVAGRLRAIRQHGKTAFIPLEDQSGEIQLFLRVDDLGEAEYARVLDVLDPGDIVGAEGVPTRTRRGEPSLRILSLQLLAKAIRPPPEKWHGLKDPELRLRQRYVDLLSSPEVRRRFEARSAVIRELRTHLDGLGFLEVETPILNRTASGGLARPFRTHYNYLEEDFSLRIALELHLKRLLVGGFEKVYEIGKVFRNEDMDSLHSPEFTMLELYWAYSDYRDMMGLVEGLFPRLAGAASPYFSPEKARELEEAFRPPWARLDFLEALEKESGTSGIMDRPREELVRWARDLGLAVREDSTVGTSLDKLFGHYVEPKLRRPTFVMDHPLETTPLAKRHREKPGRVERFELFYRGFELCNAYTELNDPDDQEARFRDQLRDRPKDALEGDEETYGYDADFVEALRFGMPPASGIGIGIDRLCMVLLGAESVKDVILFPPTRKPGSRGDVSAPP